MRVGYDSEADALSVRLTDERAARSIELRDCVVVDLDAGGHARGVEIISPGDPFARHLAMAALPCGIDAVVTAAAACIAAADRTVHIEVSGGRDPCCW